MCGIAGFVDRAASLSPDELDATGGRMADSALMSPATLRRYAGEVWRAHQSGARNHGHQLWDILMLQAGIDAAGGLA